MKSKNTLINKIIFAAVTALCGAWLSFLVCTILGTNGVIKQFLPFWLFLLFSILDLLLSACPQLKDKRWVKPAVLAGVSVIVLLLLCIL